MSEEMKLIVAYLVSIGIGVKCTGGNRDGAVTDEPIKDDLFRRGNESYTYTFYRL